MANDLLLSVYEDYKKYCEKSKSKQKAMNIMD
jgi:hypothetical protein